MNSGQLLRLAGASVIGCWAARGAECQSIPSAVEVIDSHYASDVPFARFMHLWSERWGLRGGDGVPTDTGSAPLGGYVHVFVRNGGASSAAVADVMFAGVSLTKAIAFADAKSGNRSPASLRFSALPAADIDRLVDHGEPLWWKADPFDVAPGGFAEVVVRLRRPLAQPTTLEIVTDRGTCVAKVKPVTAPRLESIALVAGCRDLVAYVRHPEGPQRRPARILCDGVDVTERTTIECDEAVDLVPMVVPLLRPVGEGDLRFLRVEFDDDSAAAATIRAGDGELVYGMWGYINQGDTAAERVEYFLGDLQRHNVNAVMYSYGGEVADWLAGESGLERAREIGIRAMRTGPGPDLDPLCYFLMDEPDAHDWAVDRLPAMLRLGSLGQGIVRIAREFRRADPTTPQLLNVDNTYKPENWYTYAQLPDVLSADPYYQEQQRIVWNERPAWAASFLQPDYVLGVATICRSAAAPKPVHVILNSVRHDRPNGGFRYATPEEKTVELFYALGGGARGISYWWYTPYGEFRGCGASDEEAVALWSQIGRLGALVRTAGPVLMQSCPADVPVTAPAKLWTRTLLAGTDTILLLAVNDDFASDRLGTVVVPMQKTDVRVTLPRWMKQSTAFELVPEGVRDVDARFDDGRFVLSLGVTRLARMVVITRDPSLRNRLEQLHRDRFAASVAGLRDRVGAAPTVGPNRE